MQTAFHDLKADDFPFTIEYIDAATGEVMDSVTVETPGVLRVPGRDRPTDVRITFPDGRARFMSHQEVT